MVNGEWANQTEREAWTAFAVTAMRARPDEGYEAWCTAADCMLEEWRKRNAGIERIHEERVKAVEHAIADMRAGRIGGTRGGEGN